jgi:hypothetical protein
VSWLALPNGMYGIVVLAMVMIRIKERENDMNLATR